MLHDLGLTNYEERIYKTLLMHGTLKGGELHQKSGVPHGKTYAALQKLERTGLVLSTHVRPKEFTAVQPKIALPQLLQSRMALLEDATKNSLHEYQQLYEQRPRQEEIRERITLLAGQKNLLSQVIDLYGKAEMEICELFTYENRPYKHIQATHDARKRGVRVRYLISKKPDDAQRLREDKKLGVELRYYPVDELRLVLIDKKHCMQSLVNPRERTDRIGMFMQSAALTEAMQSYFTSLWEKAELL